MVEDTNNNFNGGCQLQKGTTASNEGNQNSNGEGNEGAEEEGQYQGRRSMNGDCWVHGEKTSTEARGRRKVSRKKKLFFLITLLLFFK